MSERKDEKWLDDQLQRAVEGETPTFDAESWKQKYAGQFQALLRRSGQQSRPGTSRRVPLVFGSALGKLGVAAVIAAAAGVLLVGQFRLPAEKPAPAPPSVAQESPSQMVSMISLSAAFRQGGMEGLDRQCERALEKLGPRPSDVSIQELLLDISSKG